MRAEHMNYYRPPGSGFLSGGIGVDGWSMTQFRTIAKWQTYYGMVDLSVSMKQTTNAAQASYFVQISDLRTG
jgi:hypothetical protein